MTRILPSLLLLLCAFASFGQWQSASFTFQAKVRNYRTYTPGNYNPANPASLIVILHGLGGTMNDAEVLNIAAIADTANIVLLSPQALDYNNPLLPVTGAWNSGIQINVLGTNYEVNGDVYDVGFINAMMDTALAKFSIHPSRIYVCGASMGGFMTQRLACETPQRFNAVASVMGTYAKALPTCNPGKVLPMAHFHGTADELVGYDGNLTFNSFTFPVGLSVDSLVNKWVDINNCNTTPQHDVWPDANNDGFFVEHFTYSDNSAKSRVELFKVNGGMHNWYDYANTSGEIDYTTEIWKFFNKQYSYEPTSIADKHLIVSTITVYPNPATDRIFVKAEEKFIKATITDIYGRTLLSAPVAEGIATTTLAKGTYVVKLETAKGTYAFSRFVKL